jgi:DnaJ-class molecular chaperone
MSAKSKTHYETLDIPKTATETEIKKAYRTMSLKYHPDRNHDADATEKYKAINEAYEILSDEQQKHQYDMELQFGGIPGGGFPGGGFPGGGFPGGGFPGGGFPGGGFPGGGFPGGGDINDIFSMMFGNIPGMPGMGGGPGIRVFHSGGGFPGMGPDIQQMFQQMNKPTVIQKTVQITLEQVFNGDTIEIQVERQKITNSGQISEIENLMVTIPKGIDDGEAIVLKEQGHITQGVRGDIKIIFKVTNQTNFKRQGLDLIYQKKISLKESLCGFSFELHHLNGKLLSMNNTVNHSIIKPNYKKVVNGLGLPKENQTGNLIMEFIVEFPDSLSKEQIDVLKNVL